MASKEEIRKAIISIVEGKIPLNSSWCRVKAVDVAKKTCDVIFDDDEDLVIKGILLGFDKSGVVVFPKQNTDVLVIFINNTKTHGAVMMVEETEDIEVLGSEHGGIPVSDKLKTKLNNLETEINNLKSCVAAISAAASAGAGVPVTNGTLGGFFTAFLPAPLMVLTSKIDIEGKVKHGKG